MARSRRYPTRTSPPVAERVGTAEFRAHLAKYLRSARGGRAVVIEERGHGAYLLTRLEEPTRSTILGCMRDRTEYSSGTVVNAGETWSPRPAP
ncbi:MAG: type II toxin-antitoxin system Phd/YefM family antitoxin [Myxococcaceae bacterium]